MRDRQKVGSFGPGITKTLGGVLQQQGLDVFADDDEGEGQDEEADFAAFGGGEE